MGRRSEATKATYACGLNAFARCFDVQSVDPLIAGTKSGELDAYTALNKFVGSLTANGAAPKTIWIYVGATSSAANRSSLKSAPIPQNGAFPFSPKTSLNASR